MKKEIYLYSQIYDFVAEAVIKSIEENMDKELILRVNSNGGNVFATYGMAAKVKEHGNVTMLVDGAAMSSAANLLLYANHVEALDVATFVIHRADMYVENDSDQAFLDRINKDLKSKLTAKIDAGKLKELKGISVEDIFNPDQRIDVVLTAKEAKAIGLIDKITKLSPTEAKALAADAEKWFQIAANSNPQNSNQNTMTLDELKTKHPAVYAEAIAVGETQGIEKERDRVEACLVYNEIDPKTVKEAIASGKPLSEKQKAELGLKAFSKNAVDALKEESAGAEQTNTGADPAKEKTKEAKETEDFNKQLRANLGLKVS